MQKLIIASLIIACAYSAAIGLGTTCTAGTNGYDDNGICKFCHPTCLTCTGPAANQCATCRKAAAFDTNCEAPALSSGSCACAGTKLLTTKTLDGSALDFQCCNASGDLPTVTECPLGFGKVVHAANKIGCEVCNDSCKHCDVANATKSPNCTACPDAGVTAANNVCAAASGKLIIPWAGAEITATACPNGYVAVAGVCKALPTKCVKGSDATTCTECQEGNLLNTGNDCSKAATATGADACGTTCEAQKCQATAAKCTKCATGHEFTAEWTCTKKADVFGCKTLAEGKTDECKECDTGFAADGKVCKCSDAQKYIKTTAYTAKTATADAVYFKQECAACTKTCSGGKVCKKDGSDCEDPPAPTVACDDATLKDAGCNTCAKATSGDMKDKFVCSACSADQTAATTGAKGCSCKSSTHAWDKTNRKCVKCEAECTTAAPSCNLGTDGKATCGAAPTTTGTDDATNGILISAISMILAVILA